MFLVIVYPIKTVFSNGCSTIVIKDSCSKILTPAPPSGTQGLGPLRNIFWFWQVGWEYIVLHGCKRFLLLELVKRSESKLQKCNEPVEIQTREKKGKIVKWPWKICCGICKRNILLRYNSDVKGQISFFDRRKLKYQKGQETISYIWLY